MNAVRPRRLSSTGVGVAAGLAAAALFGASTPLSKRLLDDVSPALLAGLLYLGAFAAVCIAMVARPARREARLRRSDGGRLALLVLTGGVLAPVLLLVGLERLQGTTTSLLLNLEGVATLALGVTAFGEHLSRRAGVGALAVFGGALVLTAAGGGEIDIAGVALVVAACVLWGLDNNLTQSLTTRDPFSVVAVKAGGAALVNIALGATLGGSWPGIGVVGAALTLGAVAYGASIVMDVYALRSLGAAREAVIFATAPFIGALLAVPILSEHLSRRDLASGLLMAAGILLIATERHDHVHVHEFLAHDHLHVHDEHHRHEHEDGVDVTEPHAHPHQHDRLVHAHGHVSDVHHRHKHDG